MQCDPSKSVVLAEIEQLAFNLERRQLATCFRYLAFGFCALAADMDSPDGGKVADFPACRLHATTEVDLFTVQEVSRIEQPNGVDDAPSNHQEAPGNPVAFGVEIRIPVKIVNAPDTTRPSVESSLLKEQIEWRRKVAARRLLRSVAADQPHADYPDASIFVDAANGSDDSRLLDERVCIEQKNVATGATCQCQVVRAAETHVRAALDQLNLWKIPPHHIGRSVMRCVVYQDDLQREISSRRSQSIQATTEQVSGVVVDENDGDVDRSALPSTFTHFCSVCSHLIAW